MTLILRTYRSLLTSLFIYHDFTDLSQVKSYYIIIYYIRIYDDGGSNNSRFKYSLITYYLLYHYSFRELSNECIYSSWQLVHSNKNQ